MRRLFWIVAILLSGAAGTARAECGAVITQVRESSGDTLIDPFDASPYGRSLQVEIENPGSSECRLALAALGESLGPRRLPSTDILYRLTRNNLELPNVDQPALAPEIRLGAGGRTTEFIELGIVRPLYATPISSEAYFRLKLYDRDRDDLEIADVPTRMPVTVLSRAQVNVAGTAGSFGSGFAVDLIDFGTLEDGEQQTLFLQLRTNVTSTVLVRSEHGGRMVNSVNKAYAVPYTMQLGGVAVALDVGEQRAAGPSGSLTGQSMPMVVRVGEIGPVAAGTYSDTITIEIRAD